MLTRERIAELARRIASGYDPQRIQDYTRGSTCERNQIDAKVWAIKRGRITGMEPEPTKPVKAGGTSPSLMGR